MLNLKPALDAVNAAEAAWKTKAAEVADWIEQKQGTDELTSEALALQNKSLDDAEADYKNKKALYDRLVQANAPSNVNQLFVPASPTPPDGNEKPRAMKRSEFFALSPAEQKKFALNGGKVED